MPVSSQIVADKRVGAIVVKFKDEVPDDLTVLISETFQAVTDTNATWIFKRPKSFTLFPSDQKFIKNSESRKKFSQINLVFVTEAEDARFLVQVTFP